MENSKSLWSQKAVRIIAGESQVTRRVVFSFDSKYVLVICGTAVKVFSRVTGEQVEELVHHESGIITDIVLNRKNPIQVYTSSLDGHISIWDYSDGGLLKRINFGQPILRFNLRPNSEDPCLFLAIQDEVSEVNIIGLPESVLRDRNTDNVVQQLLNESPPILSLGRKPNELTFTYDYTYLVSWSKKKLILYHINNETSYRYSVKCPITSLSCHPNKPCVATGNQNGAIHLWYNYGDMDGSLIKTKLHWHPHAVADLCFSTDGTYLLSGGEESVLVLWQLATEQKHFRPRLSAPIVGVACCPGDQTFVASLESNAIKLISGINNEVEHTLVSCYRALPGMFNKGCVPTGLVLDPRTHNLVLNGSPGHLQFYDYEKNVLKSQLEVVQLNYVSRSDHKPLTPTTIDHIGFSPSGKWLATVESWDNGVITAERKLKFWLYNFVSQRYTLNTCIDPPHQNTVTDLCFSPKPICNTENESESNVTEFAVTTSSDRKFKVWICVDGSVVGRRSGRVLWTCLFEGYYHNLSCCGCGFSEDGSLVAVNFEKYITIWDPLTCELKETFNSPLSNDVFKHVTFGHYDSSHFLMATSLRHFHIWNLLNCEGVWTIPLSADVMTSDPFSGVVAIFTSSSELYIFDPHLPTPLAVHKNVSSSSVTSAIFLPVREDNQTVSSQLYFINEDQLLLSLNEHEDTQEERFIKRIKEAEEEVAKRLFHEIFGTRKYKDSFQDTDNLKPEVPIHHEIDKGLTAAPHILPSMSIYCKQFLSSLLPGLQRRQVSQDEEDEDDEDEIKEVSSDLEDEEGTYQPDIIEDTVTMEIAGGRDENEEEKGSIKEKIGEFDWLIDFFKMELSN